MKKANRTLLLVCLVATVLLSLFLALLLWKIFSHPDRVSSVESTVARPTHLQEGEGGKTRSAEASVPKNHGPTPDGSAARATPAGVLVRASWGHGPGQLGRSRPKEGNPEGPSSFILDSKGRVLVLDKVNGRIVRFGKDGRPLDSLAIGLRSPQEIVAMADGALAVMDRLADKRVVLLDENNGQVKGELALVGKDLEEGGSATGLFVDGKGVYVESEHSQVVRIGDATGKPDTERPTLDGRPSRDGLTLLSVGIIERATARFWIRAVDRETGNTRFQREVALGVPFLAIVLLDSDRTGGIYVGAHVGSEVSPGKMVGEAVQVICLSPEAEVRGVAVLPANTMPEESFRDLAVQDDGTIVYMERSESGVDIRTYRCSS